jgi:thiol-disulfide isomerase/thioredoxin
MTLLFLFFSFFTRLDDPAALIRQIRQAQQSIRTISYSAERTDTLVTGVTRVFKGRVLIRVDAKDSLFGFEFQAKIENEHGEIVYGRRTVYESDDDAKVYTAVTNPLEVSQALWRSGGRIILTDLLKLDTSKAVGFLSWRDSTFLYLQLRYPDITQYDVTKRSKTLTIDPTTLLPVAMRSHQETLGKVQDLYYVIKDIRVNDPAFRYDFAAPDFITRYTERLLQPSRTLLDLVGREAPWFTLAGFDNKEVALVKLRGKPVLLDFWEVWCGYCIESMPKVERLYEKYKDRGLQVFGIINETKQLDPSRLMVQKTGVHFPMLVGNEQLKKDYQLNGVPLYVLIDKNGKIVYVALGYSQEVDAAIEKTVER